MSSRRRRSRQQKGSNKKGNEKRMKEKLDERKPQKRSKIDKNYMWKVIVRKNAFLEWKRIEKTKKKGSFQKKTLFCQVSFDEKNLRRRIVKDKIFAIFLSNNGVSKFVLLLKKSTKIRIQRRDFKRAQTKSYTKRRNCIPNFIS